MGALEQEKLRIILLNTRNRVQKIETIYRGSLNYSQVCVGEIFKVAIRVNAAALIVVHNHFSGDPTPCPTMSLSREPWLKLGNYSMCRCSIILSSARDVLFRSKNVGLGYSDNALNEKSLTGLGSNGNLAGPNKLEEKC